MSENKRLSASKTALSASKFVGRIRPRWDHLRLNPEAAVEIFMRAGLSRIGPMP